MVTSTRKLGAILALCALAALVAKPSWSDLTIVSKMSMDSPAMKNLPAQAKAQMSGMQFTTYLSGKKFCLTSPMFSIVLDQDNKTMTMISPLQKTYSEMPYNPAMAQSMMAGPMGGMAGAMQDVHTEEDKTGPGTFLGHKVTHYVTTGHMNSEQTGDMAVHTDVLYAQDLPTGDMAAFTAMSTNTPGSTQIAGIPLKTVTTMTGGPMGSMTMTMEATSISTTPVKPSVFTIPSGYKKQDMPNMPGMGGGPGAPPPPAPTQ